ncbi:guanylate kinase [Aureimonas endophytica]|uniref:Guanylate kinase n=1 Tax=Aureimonas endophytica TaxID=2027858 RepID=A0A916ZBG4_9HYPH|nr:guanylate kinase [Aureimonas endophytica]GGD85634.1 guanylate kinase [Aureimonas endophytica]
MTLSAAKTSHAGIERRGIMLILSSPSGAGKSTIAQRLLETDERFSLSVSVTTRDRRPSEIEGRHYHFIGRDEFVQLREADALLESAEVHGNLYGTPRAPVEAAMQAGRDMLFDIDWQGAEQMQAKAKADIVSVFILPPTMAELQKRLTRRAEDSSGTIEKRLRNARQEIARWVDYDYVVVNYDLEQAFAEVQAIVAAERLRCARRPGLRHFAGSLIEQKLAGLDV